MESFPKKLRVVHEYTVCYADPIRGIAGTRVSCERCDPENPVWIWCICPEGRGGWVHEQFLDFEKDRSSARLSEDYSALELSVASGDEVTALSEVSGWYFCEAQNGKQGWIPIGVAEPFLDVTP